MPDTHRLTPGKPMRLADMSTRGHEYHDDRAAAEEEFITLREEFISWQERLYAEDKHKLLIVYQAIDAGGKDGAIRHTLQGVNPQGVRVTSFKVPSKIELAHDFLWRIHQAVPATGMIGVFNRSHYEDVLVVRVRELVPESIWRPRYEHINNFERLLHDSGTTILKFYLHISHDEQRSRLQSRLDDPSKHWKFDVGDLEQRSYWDDYMLAFEEMLNRCTTDYAPWYLIPGDQKWYRNLAVMRVLVNTMRAMNPQYPVQTADLSQIKIS